MHSPVPSPVPRPTSVHLQHRLKIAVLQGEPGSQTSTSLEGEEDKSLRLGGCRLAVACARADVAGKQGILRHAFSPASNLYQYAAKPLTPLFNHPQTGARLSF